MSLDYPDVSIRDDIRARGGLVSGGPIENFREGWAILPFVGGHGKPHYWRRIMLSNHYVSLCGMRGALATAQQLHDRGMPHAHSLKPLEPGDFMPNRCQRCALKHSKELKR